MRDFLLEFIEKIGNRKEFNLFLDLFQKVSPTKFAVIKISGATLELHMDVIAQDIAFLNKLHIYPIVVFGAGTKLDQMLPHSQKKNGFRITQKEDMGVIEETFREIGEALSEKINAHGGSAQTTEPLFVCDRLSAYGYVGKVLDVHIPFLEEAIKNHKTPIVSPLGKGKRAF
jgi:acetylglutamate kinase